MSRLTKVYGNGNITLDASQFPPIDQNILDSEINNSEPVKAAVAKLAEIEDAEENGLLARLPFQEIRKALYRILLCTPFEWCSRCHRPHLFKNYTWRVIQGKVMCVDEQED